MVLVQQLNSLTLQSEKKSEVLIKDVKVAVVKEEEKVHDNDTKETTKIRNELDAVWSVILEEVPNSPRYANVPKALDWFRGVLQENVPGGKKNRAVALVHVYRELAKMKNRTITDQENLTSLVVGWVLEMLQAAALIADDLMDNSKTRRGKPCWYLNDGVGNLALNDVIMIENAGFLILQKYCGQEPYWLDFVDFWHTSLLQTTFGQLMDFKLGLERDIDTFTEAEYETIVEYKTGYYSFNTPIALAHIISNITDKALFAKLEIVNLRMGVLFQIQDDFLDCYGNPEDTGKIGTDIIDGKCTWLLTQALKKANKEQKEILKEHYGRDSKESEQKIISLYESLDIATLFYDYEKKQYQEIQKLIYNLPKDICQEPLINFLDAIYRREK